MASIPPVVRHMILCDEVSLSGDARRRVGLDGLAHAIQSVPPGRFPVVHPQLCVYLLMSGGVGTGRAAVAVVEVEPDELVFRTPIHPVTHSADRKMVRAVVFRLRHCVFRRPGLYYVEFHYDGRVLESQPLIVR